MNARDMIAFFEYAKSFNQPPKPVKVKRGKKKDMDKEIDLVELLQRKKREAKVIEDFLKDQEKLNKKEEKKDEPKGLMHKVSPATLTAVLFLLSPVFGGFYLMWIKAVMRSFGL